MLAMSEDKNILLRCFNAIEIKINGNSHCGNTSYSGKGQTHNTITTLKHTLNFTVPFS